MVFLAPGKMSRMAIAFCLVLAAINISTSHATAVSIPPLTIVKSLPPGCGAVAQITPDLRTCAAIATFANVSEALISSLNPFVICGSSLQIGSIICTDQTQAFCNDIVVAAPGSTCNSIATDTNSTVVNVGGANSTECSTLTPGTKVCVSDKVEEVASISVGGVPLDEAFSNMLSTIPDIASIILEAQASVSLSTLEGKPSLEVVITQITPAVTAALPRPGHPWLNEFADAFADGSTSPLTITLVPKWFSDAVSSGLILATTTGSGEAGGRRLLDYKRYWYPIRTYTQNWSIYKYYY